MEHTSYKYAVNALLDELMMESNKYNLKYQDDVNSLFGEISDKYSKEINFYQEKVKELFNELVPKIENYKKEREKENLSTSCDFNVFEFLKCDENMFSSIIADMLCPKGAHGQKEAFLAAFLKLIEKKTGRNIKNKSFSFVTKIQREESTEEGRRMDIYVEFMDRFLLVIENKVWAKDQPKQVEDYLSEIKARKCLDYLFIYLTPGGSNPTKESIEEAKRETFRKEGRFATMSYKEDIAEWLNDCINRCQSKKYKYFLKDMKNTILNW